MSEEGTDACLGDSADFAASNLAMAQNEHPLYSSTHGPISNKGRTKEHLPKDVNHPKEDNIRVSIRDSTSILTVACNIL